MTTCKCKHHTSYIPYLPYVLFLLVFALGKGCFLLYNQSVEPSTCVDAFQVWRHGFSMDISTAGYLIAIPWLCSLVGIWWKGMPLRKVLLPYYVLISFLLMAIIVGDVVMYEFWKFKIDATVFSYLHSTEGATSSVSTWFLVSRVGCFLLASVALSWLCIRATPKHFPVYTQRFVRSILMLLLGGLIFLGIRGGVQESTMNVGVAYYSPRLYLNHAAVNPAFSLVASLSKRTDYSHQFDYLSEEERAAIFAPLYTTVEESSELCDTLLRTSRPNILLIMMEGFGGKFIEKLGGIPDVAPHISRLIEEGVFFDQFYANSFRTDRGTLSVFSGWTSYPNVSLMRVPGRTATLPSLAHELNAVGYACDYLYGGDIKIMGKRGYLVAAGYDQLTSEDDFSLSERNESKWGVNDGSTAQRVFQMIKERPSDALWHMGYQTLSSHEPFEVPYHRLDDEKLNAFAYTDQCVGDLVDSLRTLPQWDNLLVIILPDHGFLYDLTYENPEFFHIPMLWLGGAIREPRRINVLMNQSDLCATLLAQMGLSHDHFPWSRNVLSPSYRNPFVYSSFPGGILFRDSTGVTVFDITSQQPITEEPAPSAERIRKAQAILQTSYDLLEVR